MTVISNPGRGVTTADAIARFVAETPLDGIPGAALERARECLIDTVGSALGGGQLRAGRIALAVVQDEAGVEAATLLATGRRAALSRAAFANAVAASALDFDDGHSGSITHPGAPVIPPAMATAEARKRSGRDLLGAIVIGYEIAIRAATILNARPKEQSYGSGAPGAYGAAASVARLLGLDTPRVKDALGIARCHLPVSTVDGIRCGAMVKESVGWGALTGTMAALLAERGFTAPETRLDEPRDSAASDFGTLADLGRRYRIGEVYMKRFPACLMTHAAVEAVLHLRSRHGLRPEDILSLTVWTQRGAAALDDPAPRSTEAAQYSIPYTVAAALVDGELGVRQMLEDRLGDRRVLDLATRIAVRHDPRLDLEYPVRRPARVRLQTVGGETCEHEVLVIRGSSEAPLTSAEVDAKFLSLAEPLGGREWAQRVLALLREVETQDDVGSVWGPLWARLRRGAGASPV